MPESTEDAYRRFLGVAGDPVAAALLVLAERLQAAQESPALLTVKQCAERLNVSLPTMHRLVAGGQVKSHRIGSGKQRGAVRVTKEDLAAFQSAARVQNKTSGVLPKFTLSDLQGLARPQKGQPKRNKNGN